MQQLYDHEDSIKGGWFWSDQKKMREFSYPSARFLIATRVRVRLLIEDEDEDEDQLAHADTDTEDADADGDENEKNVHATQSPESEIIAFVHFRYLYESSQLVLYVYELQVIPELQRSGLGTQLMHIIDDLCRACNLPCIMLTALTVNARALSFYKNKCGFQIHPSSPSFSHDQDGHEDDEDNDDDDDDDAEEGSAVWVFFFFLD